MAGCAHAVKRVQVDVYCLVNPFPGWREVIQRMRSVASRWRVVELEVTMYPDSRHFDGHSVDMDKYADDVTEVGDALAVLMPDVRHLECRGINENPFARSLYGRLASHYADQLQWLNNRHLLTMPLGCQFTQLQKAFLSCDDGADYQLPQIASGELVNMSILSAPANHPWRSFSADNDSQVIEFTKLTKLKVAYNTFYEEDGVAVRHRDERPWTLNFPSLKRLHITCTQDMCPLLKYAVLPPRMESIFISMKLADFRDIANVVLPAPKRLTLDVTFLSRGDPSGLPAINRLLESACGSEWLGLKIDDFMLQVAPESITCTALTHLQIAAPTSVDTMLAYFARLPNLVNLTFRDLDLSDIRADITAPSADEDVIVEPLHSSLKGLAVNYDTVRHSPDTAVAVAKYVLLGIPTLAQLLAGQIPKSSMAGFVEEYASRYPHLSSVKTTFDADDNYSGVKLSLAV
ncbi:hypothetical protein H4R21_000762 [Coemansia helicoidea]|uniref:Uncharacterized protein n=1 Tax=Coemansia helicoidea TaxID=1286919 RepID=A0ACC1LEA4_9FUNG|nr:hypothetical protein H4R21_000762 [Coemansia helicoidea]